MIPPPAKIAIAHCAIYEKYRESLIVSNLENDTLDMDRFILTDDVDHFKDFFHKDNYHFIDVTKYNTPVVTNTPESYSLGYNFNTYRFSILEAALKGYSTVIYLECDSVINDVSQVVGRVLEENEECILTNINYYINKFEYLTDVLDKANIAVSDINRVSTSEGWFYVFRFKEASNLIKYINIYSCVAEMVDTRGCINNLRHLELNQVKMMFLVNAVTQTPVKRFNFDVKNLTVNGKMKAVRYENEERHVMKEANEENNKSITWDGGGAISYSGWTAYQNGNAFPALKQLLEREKFDTIVEIGTADGGVTLFLRDNNISDYTIHTFDVHPLNHFDEELFRDISIYTQDVFESIDLIKSIIQGGKKTLVLCDGGDKIREFNTFSKMIKPGDFIMAHDYCDTKENFDKNINGVCWSWCEIWDDPIQESLSILKKYTEIDFTNAVWLCCYKEQVESNG